MNFKDALLAIKKDYNVYYNLDDELQNNAEILTAAYENTQSEIEKLKLEMFSVDRDDLETISSLEDAVDTIDSSAEEFAEKLQNIQTKKENIIMENNTNSNNTKGITGNIIEDAKVTEITNKNNEKVKAVNFTIVSKSEDGTKQYTQCSAYGDKGDIPQTFKKGDFVNVFGSLKTTVDKNGKEHQSMRILTSKMLKAMEQTKGHTVTKVHNNFDKPVKVDTPKEAKQDLVNLKGNLISDVKLTDIKTKDGHTTKAANFTVVTHDENKNAIFHNCSAYGDKTVTLANAFHKGDFVKVFGEAKTNIGNDGKAHTQIKLLKLDMLKSRVDMQKSAEKENDKPSLTAQIAKFKSDIAKEEKSNQTPTKLKEAEL